MILQLANKVWHFHNTQSFCLKHPLSNMRNFSPCVNLILYNTVTSCLPFWVFELISTVSSSFPSSAFELTMVLVLRFTGEESWASRAFRRALTEGIHSYILINSFKLIDSKLIISPQNKSTFSVHIACAGLIPTTCGTFSNYPELHKP